MKHSDTQVANSAANDDSAITPEWVLASKFEELSGVMRETVKQRKKMAHGAKASKLLSSTAASTSTSKQPTNG